MKKTFCLVHQQARMNAARAVAEAPQGYVITVAEPTRNLEQNALLWVYLSAFSAQLEWPVNGRMQKLDAESWKDILSAAFQKETARLAHGLDGGVVMLGMRTSQMGRRQFAEFVTFIQAVAADRGVVLDEVEA
jgi:hypothetical protein